jgi:hypothetical protein
MGTKDTITFFVAVIAWNAFCLNFIIIPFFKKAETLYKDYLTNGVLQAATSFIETKRLIPALANMFVRIREAQADKRKLIGEEELQQILQQIDYVPDLELTQEAMEQNNKLKALFDSLQNITRHIWKLGLFHVIIMLCIPASQWIPTGYDLIAMITAIILAVMSFIIAICYVIFYEKQMRQFLDLLKQNQ